MLEKINKNTSYEELCRIEKELMRNPESHENDLLYTIMLRGEKEIELGYGCTLEEVYKELLGKELIESNKMTSRS